MEFKALRIAALTEEVATNLEAQLSVLCGVKDFTIVLETQEVSIIFNEAQLSFRTLVQEMTKAGCPLQNIDAAVIIDEHTANIH